MEKKDILSDFFKGYFPKRENADHNLSYKKRNYLKKYDIFYTKNNTLKFKPIGINKTCRNTCNILNNIDFEYPFQNKEIAKNIKKIKFKKRINLTLDLKNTNKKSHLASLIQLKNINKEQNNNNSIKGKNLNQEIKNSNDSKNKKKNDEYQKQMNEKADKIVNYYLTTDLSSILNDHQQTIKNDKKKTFEDNIKNKYSIDKKLLKMNNIKHQLMLGNSADFKSSDIQLKAFGNMKNIKTTLSGIKDFYLNLSHKQIKDYVINDKKINKDYINNELLNELKFEERKINFALTERVKRSYLKNRMKKIFGLMTFNQPNFQINKTEYLNFYQKLALLHKQVNKTYKHIEKRVEIRQKYKDNINRLFMINKK